MKLSAEAPARVGLTASAGMTLLSAFLLCADPAGPAIWLLVCALPLALPLVFGSRKLRIYAVLILFLIGFSCGLALVQTTRRLRTVTRQLMILKKQPAPGE